MILANYYLSGKKKLPQRLTVPGSVAKILRSSAEGRVDGAVVAPRQKGGQIAKK